MTSTFEQPQNQPPRKQRVFDEKGGMYELGKRIAEGGQGIVCPTQDPRFLVKVCKHAAGDPRAEAWGRQIAAVQRMPIDENDLPIAMPIALVTKPRPGYVMELMDGLIPLEEILRQAHEHMLTEDSLAGFLTTGGLARRLRLLARLARVLARLHGLGIAHGDLSPKNVFISRSVEHDQVWLIDCDNLTYAVRNSTLQIYTPDYGAPEIFRGELGISTYTDIWSFAVMAFQTLTLLHPFKSGSLVDADSDLETAAFRGDVAWVDHDTDDCNRAAAGIPREFVCTPKLATLFQRCFQGGLSEPELRPSMSEWAEVLEAAAALQIYCAEADGGCGSTFLWSEAMECPFCGHTKPGTKSAIVMDSMIFAHRSLLGDDAKPADQWTRTGYAQVVGGTPVSLRQSPPGTANYSESQELASIWIEDGALTIKVERGAEVTLQTSGVKQLEPLRGRTQLPVRGVRLALHLGRIDIPHNVWRLTWRVQMQLNESPLLQPEVLVARTAERSFDPQAWTINEEVILRTDQDAILMRQGDRVTRLVPGPQSGSMEHQAANPDVLWLLVRAKATQVGLKCMVPVSSTPLNKLDFCVDQRVADDLHAKGRIAIPGIPEAIEWLNEEFVLTTGLRDSQRVFAVIHARGDDRKLQLHGRRYQADLTRSGGGRIIVDRLADRPRNSLAPIAVLAGPIGFVDESNASSDIAHLDRTLLDSAVTSYGAYLDLWRLYSEKEWQRDVARAAAISAVRYASCQAISEEGGGWNLVIDQKSLSAFQDAWREHATEDDQVEIDESAPEWTSDRYTDLSTIDKRKRVRARPQFAPDGLILQTDDWLAPPLTGFIYLSLTGNRTQQERRDHARRAIESGLGVPTLNRLLQDMPLPRQRQSNLEGLTPYAKQSFKAGKATVKQELAIKVALNTPDVALIIGPPGTGKTQVIAALERRLAELNEGHAIAQQVLISSFQHDAVENALGRTDVYGLPAVKIGARRQEGTDPVDTWRHGQHAKVEAELARLEVEEPGAKLLQNLNSLLNELLIAGASADSRAVKFDLLQEMLDQLARVARIRPSIDWWSKWDAYRETLATVAPISSRLSTSQRQQLTRAVRSLRVLPESFDDDGTRRALLVLRLAQGSEWCTDSHADVLKRLSDASVPSLALLEELRALRDTLLDHLRVDRRPAKVRKTLDSSAAKLLGELQDQLAAKVAKSRTGAFGVLRQFADALVSQPAWVRRAVENYSSIVGATCQQSASRMMTELKNISSDAAQAIQFQSVIIDEAARANPLDLFIPMAMARRRIVLVGDHRQLPHILDPVIEEEIRSERGEQVQDDTYQHSLFERLWRQFKAREALDGIPRVVMLDMQFRMHPTLGDFISKHFYEAAGLEKVHSGKSEADFPETVPLYGSVVCHWVDVPAQAGGDERLASGSRLRSAEAIRTAHEVKRLLEQLPPSQSIGVITFYASQRDRIFQELAKLGLAERGNEGWHIKQEHASNPECPERLRVGTVDAFQGKEFDVVFLSVVRSSGQKLEGRADYEIPEAFERLASRKYGHLRSSNRLNVAMSRQRRLLIAVGDKGMFTGPSAKEAVPEMCAFLNLCDKEAARVQ